MTGDLDITGYKLLLSASNYLYAPSATWAKIWQNLEVALTLKTSILQVTDTIEWNSLIPQVSPALFYPKSGFTDELHFLGLGGFPPAWSVIGKLKNKAGAGAGKVATMDITELACSNLPVADPADGNSRIWSNGGVLTLGT